MTPETVQAPAASPMVAHYAALKRERPDCVLLYRVGEFYEILYADADVASRLLNLHLTRRRQKDAPDVPMCGVPSGSMEMAVRRLLRSGLKVAVCEQALTTGGERPVCVVTPGTSVDEDVLTAASNNNLVSIDTDGVEAGFAWVDLSTGEMGTCVVPVSASGAMLAKLGPSEVLMAPAASATAAVANAVKQRKTAVSAPAAAVPADEAGAKVAEFFGVADHRSFGKHTAIELSACANLLAYTVDVAGIPAICVGFPRRMAAGDTMEIDQATMSGLNVLDSPVGREGSLLSVLDRTVTVAGSRLLARQLSAPLVDPRMIDRRLDMVGFLHDGVDLRVRAREALKDVPDLLRAVGRLSIGKGGPRDLATIRDGLTAMGRLAALFAGAHEMPTGLVAVARDVALATRDECRELHRSLDAALAAELPPKASETGFIADGYDGRLDDARRTVAEAEDALAAIQARYIQETGAKSLKVKTNGVIGYHVEVPSSQAAALKPPVFKHRQGLASASRFSTDDLDRMASSLERASSVCALREREVLVSLTSSAVACREAIRKMAHAASALDLVSGLAQAASEGFWNRPAITSEAGLEIVDGRHPVAEALLQAEGRNFVPNDCSMSEDGRLWVMTGPNMSGKSTFLRQVATIALMAQVGSFVPAESCRMGVVDKLFCRVGAADDLFHGRSTFMVEMTETAAIVNQATDRSLVILDEVGRGTSTYDGLSIAQACMEHLNDVVGCKTLFATHYHELADAAEHMPGAVCMAMEADASAGDGFGYHVRPGKAGKSYGIIVAKRAGMPPSIIARAEQILAEHTGEPALERGPVLRSVL